MEARRESAIMVMRSEKRDVLADEGWGDGRPARDKTKPYTSHADFGPAVNPTTNVKTGHGVIEIGRMSSRRLEGPFLRRRTV